MSSGTRRAHVVVTGGTRGIGRATVHAFARQDAAVSTCFAHPGDASDLLEKELVQMGADYLIRQADVSDEGQVKQFIADAQERFGPIEDARRRRRRERRLGGEHRQRRRKGDVGARDRLFA